VDPIQRDSIFERLRSEPHLRDALDRLLSSIDAPRGVHIDVEGSIANGRADRFSDIDLRFSGDPAGVARLRETFPGLLAKQGRVLSVFPASHLGLDDLLVSFVEIDGVVVKIDADFSADDAADSEATTVHRLRDGDRKFVGWMWYAFAKIARGEIFESADALDTMRTRALLPLLLHVMHLPAEGYRHLEDRLDTSAQTRLHATYPRAIERDELLRALFAMADFYRELREDDLSDADFDRMHAIVRRDAAALGHAPRSRS